MRNIIRNVSILTVMVFACAMVSAEVMTLSSPDGSIEVNFKVTENGQAKYSISKNGLPVLNDSSLGITVGKDIFSKDLILDKASGVHTVKETYKMLTGKKSLCKYKANRKEFTLKNSTGAALNIAFQVSNDGVAYRYIMAGNSDKPVSISNEQSSFAFSKDTIAWLHLMAVCKSGWYRSQPSYEEYYTQGSPVGQPAPQGQGWCFPALFKTTDDIWVLLSETDTYSDYCGTHLADDSTNGEYKIAFAQPQGHRGEIDPVNPLVTLPNKTPWRLIFIGSKLNTIVESTLATDLATPCKLKDTSFIKPGKAVWHWLRLGDDTSTLPIANDFLEFGKKMKFEYSLIDANWDQHIGYEKMADFVKKPTSQGLNILLWYSSDGPWNDVRFTPKDKMHIRETRRKEFAMLQEWGVKGVKIDFFGGDKQATMKLYQDILEDAADYEIMVNFHGTTIPRGWHRTYPNLMTMEAVRGMECVTFTQEGANMQPQHCSTIPFTRNVIGPMDFTPLMLKENIRGAVNMITTPCFELASTIIFESAIQHIGLIPEEYDMMTSDVRSLLAELPTTWDDTKLIDGYPGKYIVIARRKGEKWYIAGINGTGAELALNLDLTFIKAGDTNTFNLITDKDNRQFNSSKIPAKNNNNLKLTLKTNGGFVIYN